jgi:diguanylate cyclase (GGDEF)-like protein
VRWGGEEFCLCLPEVSPDQARVVAEKLRRCLAEHPMALPGQPQRSITASLGVAMLGTGEDVAAALGRADQALYRAKNAGRNRIQLADD